MTGRHPKTLNDSGHSYNGSRARHFDPERILAPNFETRPMEATPKNRDPITPLLPLFHDRRGAAGEGLPRRPLCAAARIKLGDGRPQPWQACGYGAGPGDCRAVHVLQEAGGGALVLITLCGSRMPSTAW